MPSDKTRCLSCQARHAKCTVRQGQDACVRCQKAGITQCAFEPAWRFKICRTSIIATQRTDLVYDSKQPWVPTNLELTFVPENGDGLENISQPTSVRPNDRVHEVRSDRGPSTSENAEGRTNTTTNSAWAEPLHNAKGLLNRQHGQSSSSDVSDQSSMARRESPPTSTSPELAAAEYIDAGASHSTTPPDSLRKSLTQPLTYRELGLVQYFIVKISPWLDQLDVCEDIPTFALEVPLKATKSAMLLYSILAASSRHQALKDDAWPEASGYHSKCLELVIQSLSRPESHHDDTLLVTIIMLRYYELFSQETYSSLHLDGLAGLLGVIPDFLQAGGLAEAASWLALRQDLFIAMTSKQAPKSRLEDYDRASVFKRRTDPGAATYAIVLIWAKLLRHMYTSDPSSLFTTWDSLEEAARKWYDTKGFEPAFLQDANLASDQPFPVISMISASSVLALEYYYTFRVYLNLHKPLDPPQPITKAEKRARYQTVVGPICCILGLARSNAWVEDANFPACHILITYGYCIMDPLQRDHALRFLEYIKQSFGYHTERTAETLNRQWAEFDEMGE
ncbi:hypothetical protein E4T38_05600 [Aureobasidium subglaciale]|nr:hypothetical protein E4T38_05600 [Aureobasidium subglaciale]KAI5221257.1 hypothetical protein E4T40_05533 [Aureobasidium subglaciale]KAI5225281.1 hypothetical protein E4T41_05352 [Aureobasidium subglaciale]KAI5261372.1 hypothetical protein E4T46_05224 [Aureobasidium subglaciale]